MTTFPVVAGVGTEVNRTVKVIRCRAMTLLRAARAGDGQAFRELTEPYRRELQVHCYRILGSVQDAEDVVQETLLAAWRGLDGFEGRSRCAPGCTGSPPTAA